MRMNEQSTPTDGSEEASRLRSLNRLKDEPSSSLLSVLTLQQSIERERSTPIDHWFDPNLAAAPNNRKKS